MRSESIEWWTNVCDAAYLAEVTGVKELEPENKHFNKQEFSCKITTVLKGERRQSLTATQDYCKEEKDQGAQGVCGDHKVRPNDRLLLFWARATPKRQAAVIFWVNLTRPSARWAEHAAYDNECKRLTDGEAVVALVKNRISKEDARRPVKRRGVIIDFKDYDQGDTYWDFVRTADPAYKKVLVAELQKKDGNKESVIYNLVSYPGKETIDLIRPFLNDPTTSEVEKLGGVKGKVTYYPLRQMAHTALDLLDAKPNKPAGYRDDANLGILLQCGFESETYFHWGDWKRFKEEE